MEGGRGDCMIFRERISEDDVEGWGDFEASVGDGEFECSDSVMAVGGDVGG
jgi:hypothetical protein